MTLKEILAKKNARLIDIPDEFLTRIEKIQKQFFTDLLTKIDVLDIIEKDTGLIIANQKNLLAIMSIDLREALDETDYQKAVNEFASQFDEQKNINDKYFNEVDESFKPSRFADKILDESRKDAVERL